ncbi:MAG: hypothetical protein AAF694_24040 [Bacteroidota bacterium]
MRTYTLIVLIGAMQVVGCKPFDMVGYLQNIERNSEQLLPTLIPSWDDRQFDILFPGSISFEEYDTPYIPDSRAVDIQLMYGQMVNGGISHIQGEPHGYAALQLNIQNQPTGWTVPLAILSFGPALIPLFLGMPAMHARMECIAVVEIQNMQGRVIGTYMGTGMIEAVGGLYYRPERDQTRRAFALAMKNIQSQIDQDFGRIEALLLAE